MNILNKINKYKKNLSLGMSVIAVIGILIVLNFFSYQLFYRFDLTEQKDYSLSETSIKTARGIDDIVNIKVYFSKELPSQYIGLPQEVTDILDEYQNYSKGKIRVESIDPKDSSEIKNELQTKGIPELQFNVLEKDKYQVVKGYLGIVMSYGDKNEIIPVVQDSNNLEYQITSNLIKLTSATMPVIGYVSSNGTLDAEKDISRAYKALNDLYEIKNVDLAGEGKIDENIDTLVIAGPKEKFSLDSQKLIDKFIMKGGSALFLLDPVKVDTDLTASKNDPGLDKMLESYGFKVKKDLVLDVSNGQASFNQGYMTFMMDYPYWVKVLKGGFDSNNPVTAKLETLVLPWVSHLEIINDIVKDNKISYLLKSTNRAWLQKDSLNLSPQQDYGSVKAGQYNLAVSNFGKFKSAFGRETVADARIIVVSDSDFLKDNFIDSGNGLAFFQNMVDSLSMDEALINIRAKGVTNHPILKNLTDNEKISLRYLNVFGVTVAVVGFGLFRYYSRRKNKKYENY